MGLSTPFTRAFNLTVPVCLAPMAGVSGGRLAAAVARGGGLGVIAAGSCSNISQLDEEMRIFRDEAPPGAKLAIGIISWMAIGGDGYGVMQRGAAAASASASLLLQKPSSHGGVNGLNGGRSSTNQDHLNRQKMNGNVNGYGGGSASPNGTTGGDIGGGGGEGGAGPNYSGIAGADLGNEGLANGAGAAGLQAKGAGGSGMGDVPACSTARLESLLERYQPQAVWFFAPATPCKEAYTVCQARGVDIIAQVGTVGEARAAVEMGASVVVAQGREAGGHGLRPEVARGTLPLAAAVAVELAETGRLVLAAGGVVSGRGLLAALALGCDGVVMGTRYCATYEALGSDNHKTKLVSTSGDETVRTRVYDLLAAARPSNPIAWPAPYDSSGVAANAFTKKWNTHEKDLAAHLSRRDKASGHSIPTAQLEEAERTGDLTVSKVFMGEGAGLIYSVDAAEKITRDVAREAEEQLDNVNKLRTRSRSSELEAANRTRASVGKPASSLSANNIGDLELRDETIVRHKRANTVSVSDLSNPQRLPGTRQVISSGSAYEKKAGYSRAVRVGKHVQVAGTTATDPDGSGVLCVGDVGGQTQYIFHIIALALREAGCSLENVVRTRMYVTDIGNAEKVMAEHSKVFSNIRPAATLVCVSALVHPELLVEVEADALEP